MQFKNFLNLFESYLSNKSFGLNENVLLFFEGQQEIFALSLLNNDQNLLSQLKTDIEEKHLPVAAYWLSKGTNINQVLEIMSDYIELADKNIIKANVTKSGVTLDSKKTKQEPMPDFIHFADTVHGILARQRFNNPRTEDIEIDAENLKILYQRNNITVYEANSPQACVTLGKGHSFCISKPAGTMWQSYRDTKTSTFHFVKDQNRDLNDPLRLVVVDMTANGIELTDVNNRTGNIAEYGKNTKGYFDYLRKMGVPTELFKNMPKTPEEIEEEKLLGAKNKDLNWFKGLDIRQQSKYIGRGHELSDEQFDYIWNTNEQKLLNQYVSIGRALNSYQFKKIIDKTSLKNSYFKSREQAVSGGHDKYTYDEYSIMTPEQQEVAENKKQIDFNPIMIDAAEKGDLDAVKSLIKKGADDFDKSIISAVHLGQVEILKILLDARPVTRDESMDFVFTQALKFANQKAKYKTGYEEVLEILKNKIKNDHEFRDLVKNGNLEMIKSFVEKGVKPSPDILDHAFHNPNRDVYPYLKNQIDKFRQTQISPVMHPQPTQQPAHVRNPWLSRIRSKVGI